MSSKRWKSYDMVINGLPQRVKYNEDTVNDLFIPLLKKLTEIQKREQRKVMAFVAAPPATGKSTLLNRLTGSSIEANDRLFDTLDTSARRLLIGDHTEVVVSDTVGFIRRLPTHLIEAFKATLEELSYADLILHVIDVSNSDWMAQARVTERLCDELAPKEVERLAVFNKADAAPPDELPSGGLLISARTGEGIENLLKAIETAVGPNVRRMHLHLPFERGDLVDFLKREAVVEAISYTGEGIELTAVIRERLWGRVMPYAE